MRDPSAQRPFARSSHCQSFTEVLETLHGVGVLTFFIHTCNNVLWCSHNLIPAGFYSAKREASSMGFPQFFLIREGGSTDNVVTF
jgi:hypothetical protein